MKPTEILRKLTSRPTPSTSRSDRSLICSVSVRKIPQTHTRAKERQPTGMTPEMVDRLTAVLDRAGVDYRAEVYPGTRHGWAVADTPVYQREGAEHHWDRLLALFRETFRPGNRLRTQDVA